MSRVIVSMVSFNSGEYLTRSIDDLFNQKTKSEIEIWVLDNNSLDGSVEVIEKKYPKVKLIKKDQNLGFAKGQNEILSQAKGDYYLIVNPDTQIPEDAIEKMINFMKENPECGIASCKLVGFNNGIQSNGGDQPFGLALLSWLFNLETLGIKPNFHRQDKEFYKVGRNLGWVGGTFMMIKKEVIEQVGLLNEKYFMYVEDVEYCYRASKKSFRIMINPEVEIKHKSGASSLDNPRLFQWQNEFKNLLLFYKHNLGDGWTLTLRILIWTSLILRTLAYALLGKGGVSRTYAKILISI